MFITKAQSIQLPQMYTILREAGSARCKDSSGVAVLLHPVVKKRVADVGEKGCPSRGDHFPAAYKQVATFSTHRASNRCTPRLEGYFLQPSYARTDSPIGIMWLPTETLLRRYTCVPRVQIGLLRGKENPVCYQHFGPRKHCPKRPLHTTSSSHCTTESFLVCVLGVAFARS